MKIKIGNSEFDWTNAHTLIAAVVSVTLLALIFGSESTTTTSTTPSTAGDTNTVTALSPFPVGDIQLTEAQHQRVDQLARGAMLFVFFHETGHMLIKELNLPAIGPEEDAADEFATFFLTDVMKSAPDNQKDIYADIIFAGAMYWRLSAQHQDVAHIAWSDEHSPDMRRYFNILCIATGADPLRFIPMAVRDGVNEDRLHKCADEYAKKHEAWDNLFAPHMKDWTGRTFGGGGRLSLQVGPVTKAEWLAFEQVYRLDGFFQQILDGISDTVDLPDNVPVIVKGCGVENAWWASDTKTITLCHDIFQEITIAFAREVAAEQGGGAAPPEGGGAPPQAPPPNGAPPAGTGDSQLLAGRWQCQVQTGSGPKPELDDFFPDGRFSVTSWTAQGSEFGAWGTWSVTAPGVITTTIAGTNPPGMFSGQLNLTYQITQANTMVLSTEPCQRAG